MLVVAIVNSYSVLQAKFVDIIVHAFEFLEVKVAFCALLLAILYLTM